MTYTYRKYIYIVCRSAVQRLLYYIIYCKIYTLLNRRIVCAYIIIHYATHTRNAATLLAERGFATPPHDRAGLEPHTHAHMRALCRVCPKYIIITIIIRVVSFFSLSFILSVTRKGHDFGSAADVCWWCKSVLGAVARTSTTFRRPTAHTRIISYYIYIILKPTLSTVTILYL
jgi:hypothetical protein